MADRSVRWWWASAPPPALAELAERLAAGRPPDVVPLKSGAGRRVWALPDISDGVLLKHFLVRGGEVAKYLVRPSRAHSEFRAMLAFSRLGIPAVRAIGFGERRERGRLREAWFLGRLVPDARTLGDAMLAASADRSAVTALARQAMQVTATLHHHPWLHRDLHSDNLLLTRDGELLITDLHSVWRVPALTRAMRHANLARLLFSMRGSLNLDVDAPAVLASYAQAAGHQLEDVLAGVGRALATFEADYGRGRTARCLMNSSLFAASRLPRGRVYRRRTYLQDVLDGDLSRHAQALHSGQDVLGRSARSLVTRVGDASRDADARIVKEFLGRGPLSAVRQQLGYARARSAWIGARLLEVNDIPTAEALALLERADGSAILVTRALTRATSMREEAERLAGARTVQSGEQAVERAALARAAGFLVGRLARAGLRHADLSAKNVLVSDTEPLPVRDLRVRPPSGGKYLSLIDLDGLRRMPAHDPHGVARMLGQLGDLPAGVTRTDRIRFRHAYAAAAGRSLPRDVIEYASRLTQARVLRRERLSAPAPDARASI